MSLSISIPLKLEIVTLDFELDSINLQYFQEKAKKTEQTLLNVKATQITHNIACSVAELLSEVSLYWDCSYRDCPYIRIHTVFIFQISRKLLHYF